MRRREFAAALAGTAAAGRRAHAAGAERFSGSLTDVPGLKVGHFTDPRRPTGCTAILFDEPAAAGVDYDGSAPGEQQVVMLQPVSPVEKIHAILLSGGGVLGLGAVAGALRFHEDRKIGYDWGSPTVRIPIVVGAIIDDLAVGDARIRPEPDSAYKACEAASSAAVAEGNVGAGAGGTVGRMLQRHGMRGMKGGLGTASLTLGDVTIGALAVVNAAGDVVDWRNGRIVAGARTADGTAFADTIATLKKNVAAAGRRGRVEIDDPPLRSTTLVVVATNVAYSKTQLTKIAMMANAGGAWAVRPYHTTGDGDQLFAVSTGRLTADVPVSVTGALAAEVVAEAIVRGCLAAKSVEGFPAASDFARR
ncbi:MAG TPA: P1 family peptidase [Vicinamibacteria bacterium]|nr:P1 family peptidase [Vicinamibacteria bacterium]